MNTPERNLVLGTVRDYGYDQLRPFVESLQESGFDGKVILFASGLDAATLAELAARDVLVIPYDDADFPRDSIEIVCYRFLLYKVYLDARGHEHDNVLLTDVRDVAFQRDPFDFPRPDGLCMFLEDRGTTIADCRHNSAWIRNLFGDSVLERIGRQAISCAGTTLGTTAAIRDYIAKQVEYFMTLPVALLGTDQAYHNCMIYEGLLPQLTLYPNETGPVMTLGHRPADELRFDADGRLLNDVGQVVHTIHQYDRHQGRFPGYEAATLPRAAPIAPPRAPGTHPVAPRNPTGAAPTSPRRASCRA